MVTDIIAGFSLACLLSLLFLLGFLLFLSGLLLSLHHGSGLRLGVVAILKKRCCTLTCFGSFFRKFLFFFNLGGRLLGWCILILCFHGLNELNKVSRVLLPDHLVKDGDSHQIGRAGDLVQACKVAPVVERNIQVEDVLHHTCGD